jgi:hypothetical protein
MEKTIEKALKQLDKIDDLVAKLRDQLESAIDDYETDDSDDYDSDDDYSDDEDLDTDEE